MADLQELFARLKAQSSNDGNASSHSQPAQQPQANPSIWATPNQQQGYQPPSVSSPLFSPPIQTPNPTGSSIMSPAPHSSRGTPAPQGNNLLNLLQFKNTPGQSGPMANLQNIGGRTSSYTGRRE